MNSQKQVNDFLKEFSRQLAKKYPEKIDFILLFGSAARGEWRKGISDVDLVIQLKSIDVHKEVHDFAEQLFWELDRKYKTLFKKSCSIADKKSAIKKLQSKARLYVPFEIFAPGDMDWQHAKVHKKELIVGARLVMPQAMMFKKMKVEGKILYGRDIRKEIPEHASMWERFKAVMVPHHLAFFSLLVSPLNPKMALKMADKSLLYSIDAAIFYLEKPFETGINKSVEALENELASKMKGVQNIFDFIDLEVYLGRKYSYPYDFDLIKKALTLKYNWDEESKKFTRWQTIKFSWHALWFVIKLNWLSAILKIF
jgi:predicted nucleotidyltransferase